MRQGLAALAIGALAAGCARAPARFAVRPDGPVLFDDFESGGGPVARALLGDRRVALAEGEGVGGGRALRVAYVGGSMGSERLVRLIPLGEEGPEYTLAYDVRFEGDFQFVAGGKLHGLGPDRPVAGGDPIRPRGWSARVMWREEGRAELYTYHQDQRDRYGDHGAPVRRFAFDRGRWRAVSLHVRVNAPANAANGFVRLYIDGRLVERHEGLRLRGAEGRGTEVSRFLFSTFHGGADPSWAPRSADGGYATVHALFDDVAVYRGERIRTAPHAGPG